MSDFIPTKIRLLKKSRMLELTYDDNNQYQLSFEFLRVHSPSAEVRGHGPNSAVLQLGKRNIDITNVEPAGNYAIKLIFSDGHDSGLYDWTLLHEYCQHQDDMWQSYLKQLEQRGLSR